MSECDVACDSTQGGLVKSGQTAHGNQMNKRTYLLGCWGFFGLAACSSGAQGVGARVAVTPNGVERPVAPVQSREAVAQRGDEHRAPAKSPLEYHEESESDRVFIENAERAIREYSEFLARAGDGEEYAQAVKRSREQIEDLQKAIVFVRAGAAQRAAH
ncbi:MAG TPA: hypothetical protein VER11_06655 [Polyangiaceae bacterium]|nr:hypothetical protein [Polyangiaceae bacterium]